MNTKPNHQNNPDRPCCSDPCIGDLFPDMLNLKFNQLNKGRVFGVLLKSAGMGIQDRQVVVDQDVWKQCSTSPNFDRCLQLSMAKLALEEAVLRF
jgi:hypothetical protein